MSLLSRLNESYVPLTRACLQAGYPTDSESVRQLSQQLRREGIEVRGRGQTCSIQVRVWFAYINRLAYEARVAEALTEVRRALEALEVAVASKSGIS